MGTRGTGPTALPWSTVAIDGKLLATVPEWHLRSLLDDDPAAPASAETLRVLAATRFPYIQLQDAAGGIVDLVRVHNAALLSSDAPVVIVQKPNPGRTNEVGTSSETVQDLYMTYGRTRMLDVFTLEVGNTNLATASFIVKQGSN